MGKIMRPSWRAYAAASATAFALAFITLFVIGGSSQVVELTRSRVLGHAYSPSNGLVLLATEDGLEAFRLDGSRAWSAEDGGRACAAAPSPDGEYVAAYVEGDVLIVRAGDGEVVKRLKAGTVCVEGAELSWGPGGDVVAGVSGMGRVVAANTSDGYVGLSDWLGYVVEFVEWVNRTHFVVAVHKDGGADALLFRAEPLTVVERVSISSRYFVVEGGIVSVGAGGKVIKWVPGEGTAWETSLGSGVMAADAADGLLFTLTKDLRITAINTSDGSTAWSLRLGCGLGPSDHLQLLGTFTARDRAVGVSGTVFAENGSCTITGIYADGRNILEDARLAGAEFEGWLSDHAALLTAGEGSAILYTDTATAKPLGALYTYVAPMPYGAIVAKHEKVADNPPTYTASYEYMTPDGRTQPIPDIGRGNITGLTPTRALITREKGAALLIIGPPNPTTNLATAAALLATGTTLAALAHKSRKT